MKQKDKSRACCLKLILFLLFFLTSCETDEVYLYDNSEFLPGRQRSIDPYRSNNYRQQPYGSYAPNSRSYNNPYEIRQGGYYPYYDTERYYVPPSYYRNVEPTYDSGGASTKY